MVAAWALSGKGLAFYDILLKMSGQYASKEGSL
jgi:hypothetical protein